MFAMKRPRQVTNTTLAEEGTAMRKKPQRSIWSRVALAGLASGLVFLLAGDGPANTALIGGIDPLQIMDLEIRNNVLFIFDTSGSMKWPLDFNNFTVGGDSDCYGGLFEHARVGVERGYLVEHSAFVYDDEMPRLFVVGRGGGHGGFK